LGLVGVFVFFTSAKAAREADKFFFLFFLLVVWLSTGLIDGNEDEENVSRCLWRRAMAMRRPFHSAVLP
jgi:hypothetical protein